MLVYRRAIETWVAIIAKPWPSGKSVQWSDDSGHLVDSWLFGALILHMIMCFAYSRHLPIYVR